jgi:hypothetical protein
MTNWKSAISILVLGVGIATLAVGLVPVTKVAADCESGCWSRLSACLTNVNATLQACQDDCLGGDEDGGCSPSGGCGDMEPTSVCLSRCFTEAGRNESVCYTKRDSCLASCEPGGDPGDSGCGGSPSPIPQEKNGDCGSF